MDEFAAGVLECVVEGFAVANVSEEGGRNKSEDDAARNPIVDHCQQKPKRKPVNNRRNHIPRLQTLPLKFINVLTKLLLTCGYLCSSDSNNDNKSDKHANDRKGAHLLNVLYLYARRIAHVEHVEYYKSEKDFFENVF